MERISILGSGWLGFPLAVELKQLGYDIKASSRSEGRLKQLEQARLSAHYYDIESDTSDLEFLQADTLIINITSKNIDAFKRFIPQIESSPIKYVLFISSTSVYLDSIEENYPSVTESEESFLKPCPLLEIERLLQKNKLFQTSIIRFAGLIGYQRHPGRFFVRINEDGSKVCKPIKNSAAAVNMIHRDDCLAIIKGLLEQNIWGEIFNACSSHHPLRRDFYQSAISHLGNIEAVFSDEEISTGKVINNGKVKSVLNYRFKYDNLLDFDSMPFTLSE